MSETIETMVAIRRVTVTSDHSFDDVVAAVYAGLGRIGNFAAAWRFGATQPTASPSTPPCDHLQVPAV
jgi:hypothetical protein